MIASPSENPLALDTMYLSFIKSYHERINVERGVKGDKEERKGYPQVSSCSSKLRKCRGQSRRYAAPSDGSEGREKESTVSTVEGALFIFQYFSMRPSMGYLSLRPAS